MKKQSKLLEIIAKLATTETRKQYIVEHSISGCVKIGRLKRIQAVINSNAFPKYSNVLGGNWSEDLKYIFRARQSVLYVNVACDIFVENKETKEIYVFLLLDTDKNRKEKILKLIAMEDMPTVHVFYVSDFHIYKKREDFKHNAPLDLLESTMNKHLLIGSEFWDKIGGKNIYDKFNKVLLEIID